MEKLSYEEVCDSLNTISVRQLSLMDQLIKTKKQLKDVTSEGFFLLGKSRYIMGNTSVSTLQLPGEDFTVKALVRSYTSDEHQDDLKILTRKFELMMQNPVVTADEEETAKSCEDDCNRVVRRRGEKNTKTNENKEQEIKDELEKEDQNKNTSPSKKTVNHDPIRWFTALPPQSLRQSQNCFKKALHLSADCATIQDQILHNVSQYKQLLKCKEKYQQETEEREL
ncbi:vacuolar ATPase assembly protein VMA22 isoform X2 [Oratosquilla oratoria]